MTSKYLSYRVQYMGVHLTTCPKAAYYLYVKLEIVLKRTCKGMSMH